MFDNPCLFPCRMQAAEQREKPAPGSQRGLLRSLAALAVLRQAALSLRHYGIRCAHLYLRHSMVRLLSERHTEHVNVVDPP